MFWISYMLTCAKGQTPVLAHPLVEVEASMANVGGLTATTTILVHQRGHAMHRESVLVSEECF